MTGCTLGLTKFDGTVYSVTTASMSVPAAVFICAHCAEQWRIFSLPQGFVAPLECETELASQFVNKVTDVFVVNDTDDAAATGTLHK